MPTVDDQALGRPRFVARSAIAIPVAVIALLMFPLLATDRTYGHDWTLHLWLVRQQQWNIEVLGHPGLFVSARPFGAFYPMFAFVGSGMYVIGGYLAIALGNRPVLAYKLLYGLGLVLAYGGMTWLSVQLGLRRWRAQVPGLVLVTGTYFITDFVGRGDFGEFMALAAVPFVLAAARAILTSQPRRMIHVLALVFGVFVLTGSHNITLLWASVFFVAIAIVGLIAMTPRALPSRNWKRIGTVAVGLVIGAGLNAWYLLPDLAYGFDTIVGRHDAGRLPKTARSSVGLLLDPFRPNVSSESAYARDIRLGLPWFFAVWAVVVAALVWRRRDAIERRFYAGLFVLTLAFVVLALSLGPWRMIPSLFYNVQYTWRLHGYVLLGTALLVLIALRGQAAAPDRVRHATGNALAVVFNLGAAIRQEWGVRSEYVRSNHEVVTGRHFAREVADARYHAPPSWYSGNSFRDETLPIVATARGREVDVPLGSVHGASVAGPLDVPDGREPVATNISAGPNFVEMTGIRMVGRSSDGTIVATRAPDVAPNGPVIVTIHAVHSAVLALGVVVSLLSTLALIALVAAVVWPLRRHLPTRRVEALGFDD